MEKEFTCEACEMQHGHPEGRVHDLSDLNSVDAEYLAQMEFNPTCNCGWNEALRDLENGTLSVSEDDARTIRNSARTLAIPTHISTQLGV